MEVLHSDLFEFFATVFLLHGELSQCVVRHASHLGLSPQELAILWVTTFSQESKLADIARFTGQDKESVAQIAASLQEDGLIERIFPDNLSYSAFRITPSGRDLVTRVAIHRRNACPLKKAFSTIEREDFETVKRVLHHLVSELRSPDHSDWISRASQQLQEL